MVALRKGTSAHSDVMDVIEQLWAALLAFVRTTAEAGPKTESQMGVATDMGSVAAFCHATR